MLIYDHVITHNIGDLLAGATDVPDNNGIVPHEN